jgi:hypothetical protein
MIYQMISNYGNNNVRVSFNTLTTISRSLQNINALKNKISNCRGKFV